MAVLLLPACALAEDAAVFAGLDLSGGWASGSSSTTDGGAAIAGGGVAGNVTFGQTAGIGGHLGYRFDPSLSTFISYGHLRGSVSWDAAFPLFGVASNFRGDAISNLIMGNLAYDWALSDTTSLRASAGLGLSLNSLSGVVESDEGTGLFLADVADHTHISPAAGIGAGIQHKIAPNAALGVNAAVSYVGGFETGDTRSGNLGVTAITPYRIDHVWRANLGASLRFDF
jgi:hypothetical protein